MDDPLDNLGLKVHSRLSSFSLCFSDSCLYNSRLSFLTLPSLYRFSECLELLPLLSLRPVCCLAKGASVYSPNPTPNEGLLTWWKYILLADRYPVTC